MGFYSNLSAYFDEIFPVEEEELSFLQGKLGPRSDLLDVGCATGSRARCLVAPGRRITGIDLNTDMLALAERCNADPSITFQAMDMADLTRKFAPGSFDAVLCLGNTLVHQTSLAGIASFIASVRGLLRPGGLFISQIVNFDQGSAGQELVFPLRETDRIKFHRKYVLQTDRALFFSTLVDKTNGTEYEHAVRLYPLRRNDLEALLADSGFSQTAFYGGFSGRPHTPDALLTVSVSQV